jgi:hypothetical protein
LIWEIYFWIILPLSTIICAGLLMTADRIDRMVMKFRDVLAETERLHPGKLQAYQENLLIPLVLHAFHHVPFYQKTLARFCRGRDVDLSRWHEVPILTRAEAQRNIPALTAEIVPPHGGAVTAGETSGSLVVLSATKLMSWLRLQASVQQTGRSGGGNSMATNRWRVLLRGHGMMRARQMVKWKRVGAWVVLGRTI